MWIVHDHTALELLTNALGVAVPPPPRMLELAFWLQTLAMWSVAPYHTVRIAARWWKGRAVPLMTLFVILGGLRERQASLAPRA